MVPPEFANFFIASASAGAALVGLLFVAVSLAPENIVTRRAPMERQAVAGSAFTALMNAFFISLFALIPHFNFGFVIVPFISLYLLTTLIQAWQLLRWRKRWPSLYPDGPQCSLLCVYTCLSKHQTGTFGTG